MNNWIVETLVFGSMQVHSPFRLHLPFGVSGEPDLRGGKLGIIIIQIP